MFKNFPIIETRRLILSELKLNHSEDILNMRSFEPMNKYIMREATRTLEMAKESIKKSLLAYTAGEAVTWIVTHKKKNQIVGTCGLNSIDTTISQAHIGGELLLDYWGKGFAIEAIEAILDFGFNTMNLKSIHAKFSVENKSAKILLEKFKFRDSGLSDTMIFRDKEYKVGNYYLLKEDL